jgi:hypothetical protein
MAKSPRDCLWRRSQLPNQAVQQRHVLQRPACPASTSTASVCQPINEAYASSPAPHSTPRCQKKTPPFPRCVLDHPTEAGRAPRPSDASTAAQQAISGLLINLPLAVSVGLSHPTATSNRTISITVTPELASSLAAGRQLWQQQASKTDVLLCSPFNGPVELLRAAESPVAGAQAQQQVLDTQQIAAARAAFAAAARAVASQAAARAKGRHHHSSSRNTLDAFRKAVILPGQPGTDGNRAGVLPGPAGDAAADVWWDGSDRMTAVVQAGPSMTAPAAHTATEALHDGVVNIVPWLTIQASLSCCWCCCL